MTSACRVATHVCTMAAMLALGAAPLRAQIPTNLRVDGLAGNPHVAAVSPTFCWDFSGPQTNWQIQVDDDPAFHVSVNREGAAPSVWFWDSGTESKGRQGSVRCAEMRQVSRRGTVSLPLDSRTEAVSWRIRIQSRGAWGPWVPSSLRINQPPMMPAGIAVSLEAREGTIAALPSAAPVSGVVRHVSILGDDDGDGTARSPWRTLARATKSLEPGDTLLVHGGTYEENLVISALSGHASGRPGRPIVLKAAEGEAPVLRAPASGSRIAMQIGQDARLSDWVFEGLTIGGAATQEGIVIGGARRVSVRGCRWEGDLGRAAAGIRIDQGSEDIRIEGCQFDQPLVSQIEINGASGVEIRASEFTAFDGGRAILARRGTAGLVIEGNRFRDARPGSAAVELAGAAPGTRVALNLFYRIGGNEASAVRAYRGPGLVLENNVFHAVDGSAVTLDEHAGHARISGNIVSGAGTGLAFRGGDSSVKGSSVDFNLFWSNGSDLDWGGSSRSLLAQAPSGNCLGGSGDPCDPLFTRAEAGDFRLLAGSPAIDAGDPFAPIPEGGGARRDIGRHERGASGDGAEAAFSLSDTTPRITWALDDLNRRFGVDDAQARFQLQIDSRPTFDGAGGAPLLDTGSVASPDEQYIVPSLRALAPGDYNVRIRQWDGQSSTPGVWSVPVRFRIVDAAASRARGAAIAGSTASGTVRTGSRSTLPAPTGVQVKP